MAEPEGRGGLACAAREADLAAMLRPRGVVTRAGDGVAEVAGLDRVGYEELVRFDSGALGIAFDLRRETTGVLVLSGVEAVRGG
jgi:F0F1-type ATP synthase alpha subunit